MGGDGKPGSPEQKIKRFLDSCAYLLLRDNPEGTLTDYKEVMHGRNEIDVSSCPSWIADRMDAGGCTLSGGMEDERTRFECLLDKLDSKVTALENKPAKRWEGLVDKALWAVGAALIGFVLAKLGL